MVCTMYRWLRVVPLFAYLLIGQLVAPSAAVVDAQGQPTAALLQLFRSFAPLLQTSRVLSAADIDSILDPQVPAAAITLTKLNRLAQDKFLRPAQLERYQIAGTLFEQQLSTYDTPAVRALLEILGLVQAIRPRSSVYHYLLVNGSTVASMRQRITTLARYITDGEILITPDVAVVFLTGDRDLTPSEVAQLLVTPSPSPCKSHDMPAVPVDLPTTEYQAARWIWRQADLPLALRQAKLTFVNAAKQRQVGRSGALSWRRPNTADTVQTWLRQQHPKPGSCLSLSHQPYVLYQALAIRTALTQVGLASDTFTVEGVGEGTPNALPLALLMDSLARILSLYTLQGDLSGSLSASDRQPLDKPCFKRYADGRCTIPSGVRQSSLHLPR